MCAGPFFPDTVSRKKSPKPTRYMRTRIFAFPEAAGCFPAGAAFGAAVGEAFPAAAAPLEVALARVFRVPLATVFREVFLAVFVLAISRLLVHEAEIGLEVGGIGGVAGRHPQRHRKTALLLLAQLRGGAGHSFANGKAHLRLSWVRIDRAAAACQLRRLDDERDAAAERK